MVVEFAKMNIYQLLEETEKAVSELGSVLAYTSVKDHQHVFTDCISSCKVGTLVLPLNVGQSECSIFAKPLPLCGMGI